MLATAVDRDSWMADENAYAGFVFDHDTGDEYRPLPSGSWTNGLSVAVPMLMAAHRLQDATMREHALTFITFVV